ncbi:MAG: hypothetical protein ABJE66_03145 [Deltaproteobacteria bacterium]
MGWFSRTSDPAKPPRWGFTDEWEQFVGDLVTIAAEWELALTPILIKDGRIDLPDHAAYDYWDLKALAGRCRDLEPHQRDEAIRADLLEMFGHPATRPTVEPIDEPAPQDARDANVRVTRTGGTPLEPGSLRAQIFGEIYFSMLDHDKIACRKLGDAWLVMVQEVPGGEATVTHEQVSKIGLDLDAAFDLGIAQGIVRMAEVQIAKVEVPGAKVELVVANEFFLSALMLSPHAPGSIAPDIKCPITWHHWLIAELEPTADRATIEALQTLVNKIGEGVQVGASEWIGTSLWYWPPDSEPTPFTLDTLPAPLAGLRG